MVVEAFDEAPFLAKQQKRDTLYANAARFLRLSKEAIAASLLLKRLWARRPASSAEPYSVRRMLTKTAAVCSDGSAPSSSRKSLRQLA